MGFMNSSVGFVVCEADSSKFDPDKLHDFAFTSKIDGDGVRQGWVGLGDPLDDAFAVGMDAAGMAAFSLRVDTRKASSAAVKLKLAEKVREEEGAGKPVSGARKKELREAIAASLTAKAEFVPALTDFLWLLDKNRLLVSVSSLKGVEQIAEYFQKTFGVTPSPLTPKKDMAEFFGGICRDGGHDGGGFSLAPYGSASLSTSMSDEDKATVAVQNNLSTLVAALDEGYAVQKLRLVGSADALAEFELDFSLDSSLVVSGLKLPKGEKGMEKEADFLLKADAVSVVADLVENLAS